MRGRYTMRMRLPSFAWRELLEIVTQLLHSPSRTTVTLKLGLIAYDDSGK